MTWLSDDAVDRLRRVGDWPDFSSTRYSLQETIGEGGMGRVFRAHDRELDRVVAIKVTAWPGDEDTGRLRREAQVLASLEHPGIVPIHDAGVLPDGRSYYVMKFVRGKRLDAALDGVPALTERLRLFDRLCDTIAFAHARGLVHRDLKPGNVMVGGFGEVLVLDWGLARPRGADAGVGGTRGYMAPDPGPVNVRSDVYALGAILRDLVQACPSGTRERPLRSIITRAMSDDPDHRYPDASALAEDVRRCSAGARVNAHQETALERSGRLLRTYRTPIALVLAYVVMRVLLLIWGR